MRPKTGPKQVENGTVQKNQGSHGERAKDGLVDSQGPYGHPGPALVSNFRVNVGVGGVRRAYEMSKQQLFKKISGEDDELRILKGWPDLRCNNRNRLEIQGAVSGLDSKAIK